MLCPCFKCESGLKKTDMLVGRQTTFRHARGKADNILLPHMQKSPEVLTQKYSKENRKQTMNILQQFYVKDMILFASTIF